MIQDIGSHRLDNQYYPARKPRPYDAVIACHGRKLLIRDPDNSGRLSFLTFADYLSAAPAFSTMPAFSTTPAVSTVPALSTASRDPASEGLSGAAASYEVTRTPGTGSSGRPIISTAPQLQADDSFSPLLSSAAARNQAAGPSGELIYLFAVDGRAFFLTHAFVSLPGYKYVTVQEVRAFCLYPQEYIFAAFTAAHLGEWYRRKQFCGVCGSLVRPDAKERAMRCPACGEIYYPRINPAVIVGVINKECLLITRYLRGYGHNALVAGFTEIGETLEETVSREVMEETGLKVKNIRYYKSQPWGIASDLLAGFFCDVDGDDTVRLDGNELKSAVWTPRGEVTWQPPEYSLTADMMRAFRDGIV